MSWAGNSHRIEVAAEWGAPLLLAGASAWAAWSLQLPVVTAIAAGIAALAGGLLAMRVAGRTTVAGAPAFEPAEIDNGDGHDELLLDNPLVELLLDDPLIEPESNSRVVQLFARQDPTPGELVLRISDYLNGPSTSPAPHPVPADQAQPDASAALHAALANIRASLR